MLARCMICLLIAGAAIQAEEHSKGIRHGVVYQQEGQFAGWPANHGIWSWEDEIVVGFELGHYKRNPRGGHDIDPDKPSVANRQACQPSAFRPSQR